jgi:hypothetical protein
MAGVDAMAADAIVAHTVNVAKIAILIHVFMMPPKAD